MNRVLLPNRHPLSVQHARSRRGLSSGLLASARRRAAMHETLIDRELPGDLVHLTSIEAMVRRLNVADVD